MANIPIGSAYREFYTPVALKGRTPYYPEPDDLVAYDITPNMRRRTSEEGIKTRGTCFRPVKQAITDIPIDSAYGEYYTPVAARRRTSYYAEPNNPSAYNIRSQTPK
ncbi:hypothetical protein EIK77_004410 [Talaromyces pinophilus]|nr:hypothetical protein EIK77_004410 [Talaromyces pinophilus]